MATMNVAIEIGTSFTSIYLEGAGVVLREPTVVAYQIEGEKREVFAVGNKAIKLQGKTPGKTAVVCPVVDGYIVDEKACIDLMTQFINKILPISYVFFPKIKAILVTPTGLNADERKLYEDVIIKSGVAESTMIDNVVATALGAELPVETADGGFVTNIGGGVTEIALISLCGAVSGCSINVGGNMMDKALMDFIVGKYGVKVGLATARKIREEVGTLHHNDTSYIEVSGINVNTQTPVSQCVYALDAYEALLPYYARIVDAIKGTMNMCPPDLAKTVYEKGLNIAGGVANVPEIANFFADLLNIPCTLCPDPELTSIIGAGKLLSNGEMLKQILSQQ